MRSNVIGSEAIAGVVASTASNGRFARAARHLAVVLAFPAALATAPAYAADPPETLPVVTVTATRNPGETPVEAAYTDTLLQRLTKNARYPTGRAASETCPSGTSTVYADLNRNGKVAAKGVEHSSGSQLLDQRAVELVAREKYAALPKDGWADGPKHRFVVSYKFDCNAATAPKASNPKK